MTFYYVTACDGNDISASSKSSRDSNCSENLSNDEIIHNKTNQLLAIFIIIY